MKRLSTLVLLVSKLALASDEWLCTDESSQRRAGSILACGIGTGHNENDARVAAFVHAAGEFTRICNLSTNCKDHAINVVPKRTACDLHGNTYKCYRLISFDIEPHYSAHSFKQTFSKLRALAKLKMGMTKNQLLHAFGMPAKVENLINWVNHKKKVLFRYEGKMCTSEYGCHIFLTDDIVTNYDDFKPSYMDME